MTDNEIIAHLNTISDTLTALQVAHGSSINLKRWDEHAEQNRYSVSIGQHVGWGGTPACAYEDLINRFAEAIKRDEITAKVEAYRKQLEQELAAVAREETA